MYLVQTYADGKTTMSVYERKASIREFYGICLFGADIISGNEVDIVYAYGFFAVLVNL